MLKTFDGELREGYPRTGAVEALVEGMTETLGEFSVTQGEVLSAFHVMMARGIASVRRHHPTPDGRAQLRLAIAGLLMACDEPGLPA